MHFRWLFLFLMTGCTIPFYMDVRSDVAKTASIPSDSIAVQYTQYPNTAVANLATKYLFQTLQECSNLKLIAPDSLEERLIKTKLTIPEHLTKSTMQEIYAKTGIRYLLVSQLEKWEDLKNDSYSAITTLNLVLFDLKDQDQIWLCRGSKDPLVSNNDVRMSYQVESEFKKLVRHLLKQWPAFCQAAMKQ